MTSPIDVATFRANQAPAFDDASKFPASSVTFYINLAYMLLNVNRWGTLLDFGATLFVSHWLTLGKLAVAGGANGIPGTAIGILTGGTVDKVSYTKDVQSVIEEGAGHWNMTIYGLEFWRLAQMMGAGPIQIGMPAFAGPGVFAWPGVILPLYGN